MILASLKTKLLGALGLLAGLFAAGLTLFLKGRQSKAREVQAKTAETVIETTKRSRQIDEAIRDTPAADKRKRLRQYARDSE